MGDAPTGYDLSTPELTNGAGTAHDIQQPAWHLIHRLGQRADEMFVKDDAMGGLTPRQFIVLQIIDRQQGISQTGIVGLSGIDRSTTADIVQRLLRKKLVNRRRAKTDARRYSLRLTDLGQQALEHANPAANSVDHKTLAVLSSEQRSEFVKALAKIVEHLELPNSTDSKAGNS